MRGIILLGVACIFFVQFLASCNKKAVAKKERWAVIINFFSPDTTYYPPTKKFPFPDSLQFASLEDFFTNQDKPPVISDSTIIFYDSYWVNDQKVCCKTDTLDLFIDTIRGKKYLFAIGEYVAVFQSDTNLPTGLRKRKSVVPDLFWGIRLNTPYGGDKFVDEYEKLGARFVRLDKRIDEVARQKWADNDSLLVETIQFNNSTQRIVTTVYRDIQENQMNSMISQLKTQFPGMIYSEAVQKDSEGKEFKVMRMYFSGVSISLTQTNATEYSFTVTDYYETIRLILANEETGYHFRDDVRVY